MHRVSNDTSRFDSYTVHLTERIKKDLIMNDDGYYVYCQSAPGYLGEAHLRLIADTLHEMNKDWDESVNEFFR